MKAKSLFLITVSFITILSACSPALHETPPQQIPPPVDVSDEIPMPVTADPLDELKPVALAILRGSVFDRKALVQYTSIPCTTADGLGGPPKCLEGETEGTLVTAFPFGGSESSFARPNAIDGALRFDIKGLYAIYRVQPSEEPGEFPMGEYALLFERSENDYPIPVIAFVQDGKLIGLDFKIGIHPQDVLEKISADSIVVAHTEVETWLGETELLSQSTASDDGAWFATTLLVHQPSGGGPLYRNLTINEAEGPASWRVVDEWLPNYGLGFTSPLPLYWSSKEPVVYWTNTPTPDGCAIFVNGYDLHKLDLTTGESTQFLAEGGLWLAVAPDETKVAFVKGSQLVIHPFEAGEDRSAALPEGQAGQIVWSPDNKQLVLTIANDPCGDPALNTYSIVRLDTDTMTVTTLIDHESRLFSTQDWSPAGSVLLADQHGAFWQMDAETGQVWQESAGWLMYNNSALKYSFEHPDTWAVNEDGLTQSNQEIFVTPPDGEPFVAYFSVLVDERTMNQIQSVYSQLKEAQLSQTQFAGQDAIQYTFTNSSRVEYYIPYGEKIYLISTDRPTFPEVNQILASFTFMP